MSRRLVIAACSALLLALAIAAQAQGSTRNPTSESENPIGDQGSSFHFRSQITAVEPSVSGVSLQVLEFADRLLLTNHSGQDVTVLGYQNEPYARVLANGAVQLNTRSPAYYLNQSFFGNVKVPASASPSATPSWVLVDRTGQLEWHDHRIHWMSPALPPQVKNQALRTKIFDWRVPIEVGTRKGAVDGELLDARERLKDTHGCDRCAGSRGRARPAVRPLRAQAPLAPAPAQWRRGPRAAAGQRPTRGLVVR